MKSSKWSFKRWWWLLKSQTKDRPSWQLILYWMSPPISYLNMFLQFYALQLSSRENNSLWFGLCFRTMWRCEHHNFSIAHTLMDTLLRTYTRHVQITNKTISLLLLWYRPQMGRYLGHSLTMFIKCLVVATRELMIVSSSQLSLKWKFTMILVPIIACCIVSLTILASAEKGKTF